MVLKQQYISKLIEDRALRLRLAVDIEVDPQTIDRRLGLRNGTKLNVKKLSTPRILNFLSTEWGIEKTNLTEES
jgi:hypothetical protein